MFFISIALAIPTQLTHTGRILDGSGVPVSGPTDLGFAIYDQATGGTVLWSSTQTIDLDGGYYAAELGGSTPFPSDLFDGSALYVEVTVGGTATGPRQSIRSVPYAMRANDAVNVDGGVVDASEIYVDGTLVIDGSGTFLGPTSGPSLGGLTCLADQIALYDGSVWGCTPVPSGGSSSWTTLSDIPTDLQDGDADDWSEITNIPADILDGDADDWSEIANIPADILDGDADDWSEIANIPADLLDGDADTQLTEGEVENFITNGPLNLDVATTIAGAAIVTSWTNLPDIPAGFADDVDDDTQLSEAEVETFVTNGPLPGISLAVDTTSTCAAGGEGAIRWTGTNFEGCTSDGWVSLGGQQDGGSAATAARDCAEIKAANPTFGDGNYWIDLDGSIPPIEVQCDMTTDGGGWTRFWWREAGAPTTTDVLGDDLQNCSVSNPACYAAIPDTSPGELLASGDSGWGRWTFNGSNSTSNNVYNAFVSRTQITGIAGRDQDAWNPDESGGGAGPNYTCSSGCDSFYYTNQGGVVSFYLDDDTGWCWTAFAGGNDNNGGTGADAFDGGCVSSSTNYNLSMYWR